MEKISLTNSVIGVVLHRIKEDRGILGTIKKDKTTGYILPRDFLLNHVI
jgi:hypothetical protein